MTGGSSASSAAGWVAVDGVGMDWVEGMDLAVEGEGWAAGPTVTFANVVDDDKDMSQDGVWLLGEQRWERKEKLTPKE